MAVQELGKEIRQDPALRLMIVDDSVDDAEAIANGLRNSGIAVRPTRPETIEELAGRVAERQRAGAAAPLGGQIRTGDTSPETIGEKIISTDAKRLAAATETCSLQKQQSIFCIVSVTPVSTKTGEFQTSVAPIIWPIVFSIFTRETNVT